MKYLIALFLFLSAGATQLFAQNDFTNDTLHYEEGTSVHNIDFFGLERTLNWDTIYQNSQLNKVVLKFHNHTNTPIEIKKFSSAEEVVVWGVSNEKMSIPPNGVFEVNVSHNFKHGDFQSNFNIKFKHLGKKHLLTFHTFGFAEGNINGFNTDGKKQGKWLDINAEGYLKQLYVYENGELHKNVRYFYFPTGKIRLKMDLLNHLDTYYLETGEIEFEMRPDSRIDYFKSGVVKSIETDRNVFSYNEEGNQIKSRKQHLSKALKEYQMLLEESSYPNGNIEKQTYANGKQFHYSEQVAGCVIQLVDGEEGPFQRVLDYENCELAAITTSSINNIDGTGKKPYSISKGEFQNEKLINGRVEQYNHAGELSFTEEIKSKRPTKAIWLDGVKYNVTNAAGRKQGMWISNQSEWADWRNSFSTEILVKGHYENGVQRDTVFYYYPGGKLKGISIKTFNIKSPSTISYYESGNISGKTYSYYQANKYRFYKIEKYDDTPNTTLSSININGYEFVYNNGRILSRQSPVRYVDNAASLPEKNRDQYTLATGSFKKGYLYNGKITHKNEQNELLKTVRVVDGKVNGDRILIFDDPAFENELLSRKSKVDRDHNGYITRSEIENLRKLEIQGKWIESVTDFKYFKQLRELYVNGRKVKPEVLTQPIELLNQVQQLAQLSKIREPRYDPWPITYPDPDYWIDVEPEIDFYVIPDKDPEFPGGPEAMMQFIKDNIRYPDLDSNYRLEGTVYVGFVVNKNGTLEQLKILKGITDLVDEEALRLVKSMQHWIPGEQSGNIVRTRFVIPIRFEDPKKRVVD
ncbi:MAG: TonB family protein [Crocinitomix sp.]|nr:TonB family protein [Crocinitomix sp.]